MSIVRGMRKHPYLTALSVTIATFAITIRAYQIHPEVQSIINPVRSAISEFLNQQSSQPSQNSKLRPLKREPEILEESQSQSHYSINHEEHSLAH